MTETYIGPGTGAMDEERRAERAEIEPNSTSAMTVPQGDAFCGRCGSPRQQAVLVCRCGQVFANAEVMVDGDRLVGASPMVLPERCIKCNRNAVDGRRYDSKALYWSPGWAPVTLLLGLLSFIVVYYATRKELRISYSRCADCRDSKLKIGLLAGLAWTGCVVFLVAATSGRLWCLWVTLSLLVVASALTIWAVWGLRVASVREPLFTVEGFGPEFIASMRRAGHQ